MMLSGIAKAKGKSALESMNRKDFYQATDFREIIDP